MRKNDPGIYDNFVLAAVTKVTLGAGSLAVPEYQPLLAATAAGTLPAAVAAGVQGPATRAAGTACTLDRQWPKVAAIIAPVLLANISIRNPPILLFIRA